jgi:hypothetical protein
MQRKPAVRRVLGLVLCCAFAALVYAATPPDAEVRAAAAKWLASLSADQKAKACFAFDDSERVHWAYVPQDRRGLPLADMNEAQRALAMDLVRSTLSPQGFAKVEGVIKLEPVLRELESRPDAPALHRDAARYYVSIFGDPSSNKPWAWRFEGHHLSLNFSSIDGELDGVTPNFFGANPARVAGGPDDGLRVLGVEEDLGRALFASFDDKQRSVALLSGAPPNDVILGPSRDGGFEKTEGLAVAQMTAPQAHAFEELLTQFVGNLRASTATAQMQRIRDSGLEKIHFAWIGSAKAGEPHYYRIQGLHFAIEYENAQPGANHIHVVWRDLERDFGADLLRAHLARDHAGK